MTLKSENITDTDSVIDGDVLDGYSQFDIGVIPVVKPVGRFEAEAPSGAGDGFNPPPIQGGYDDGMGEITTLEECISLSRMLWNTPGMLMGDHLTRSDEQIELYGKELYLYCSKKGIDPRDYVGDYMPLLVMTGTMSIGLWKDHKIHKREKLLLAGTEKTFDSTTGHAEDYTPVEEKTSEYDSASGNNLPDELADIKELEYVEYDEEE